MESDSLDNSIAGVEQDIRGVESSIREAEIEAKKAADAGDLTERDFWRAKELLLRKLLLIREEKARSEALQPADRPQLRELQEKLEELQLTQEKSMKFQEQLQLTQEVAVKMRNRIFRYSDSKISRGSNKKLRQRLIKAYGSTERIGLQRCMLTGEYLPAQTVIAAHLYKHEWREYAEADIGLLDIDDVGNGLLLWKPLEYAFDTSALSFIYDKTTESFGARVLNPSLHSVRLCDLGMELMGVQWRQPPPDNIRAANLTFADIDGTALSFPPGCLQRPLKRVLCYQAHLAKRHAADVGWLQLDFEDFWSDQPYMEKVMAWLAISERDSSDLDSCP